MTADATVKPPKHLSAAAKAKFREVAGRLAARRVALVPADADRLAEYADAWVLRARAVADLAGQPLVLSGPNGAAYTNPLLKVISQAEKTLHAVSRMYGLDLLSRAGSKDELGGRKDRPGSALNAFALKNLVRPGEPVPPHLAAAAAAAGLIPD